MAVPSHMDRLPAPLLRDILHRAAVRLDCTDGGLRALVEMRTCKDSRAEWAQVRELCRLQAVSKRFHQVASTVKNLHCRITPQAASKEVSGLANFLSKARCAEGLALTFGPNCKTDPEDDPEKQFSLFRTLAESQCFQELFTQAPCLECVAVVKERFTRSEVLGKGMAADLERATTRLLEALSANCPRLSALALGCGSLSSVRFPVLAPSLACKPFSELRRLCIYEDVQIDGEGQGLTCLLRLCPSLLQLEVERDPDNEQQAAPDPEYLLIASDSLEVLAVEIPYGELALDIRTPKLRNAKLGWEVKGTVLIAAPNLNALAINCSAKLTVLAPWEQLERLVLMHYPGDFFVWDSNNPLHEALESCSHLKSLSVESQYIKNLSCLTDRLGSLTELSIADRVLCEVCKSNPESLRELQKLTVSFDQSSWRMEALDDSRLLKALRSVECFPELGYLRLGDTGTFTPRAAQALLSLQRSRPTLEIVFEVV